MESCILNFIIYSDMNLDWRICFTEGLYYGFFLNIYFNSFWIYGEYFLDMSLGYSLDIFLARSNMLSPLKGYSNVHNSYNTHPNDHISDLKLYPVDEHAYGLK